MSKLKEENVTFTTVYDILAEEARETINKLATQNDVLKEEIVRLRAELDADDLMASEAELFRPEYEKQLEAENVRLQAQIATLEDRLKNAEDNADYYMERHIHS